MVGLRGRLQEEEDLRRRLWDEMRQNGEDGVKAKEEAKEVEERLSRKINEGDEERREGKEEWKKEMKEMEERLTKKIKEGNREGRRSEEGPTEEAPRHRCIVMADSNGCGATRDSILSHVPREERHQYDIEVVRAYTVKEALRKAGCDGGGGAGSNSSGNEDKVDIRGAYVILDCLTNNIRHGFTPAELTYEVARVRGILKAKGAADIVVCEIKPMAKIDVTPYNMELNDFLKSVNGFGCNTQIRVWDLKEDGVHVKPDFGSVIDRTYACAIRGVPVPCPTPPEAFISLEIRRRWEMDWPRLRMGGPKMPNHGRW